MYSDLLPYELYNNPLFNELEELLNADYNFNQNSLSTLKENDGYSMRMPVVSLQQEQKLRYHETLLEHTPCNTVSVNDEIRAFQQRINRVGGFSQQELLDATDFHSQLKTSIQKRQTKKLRDHRRDDNQCNNSRLIEYQSIELERAFSEGESINRDKAKELAERIGMPLQKVMNWFHKRRQRAKKRRPDMDKLYAILCQETCK